MSSAVKNVVCRTSLKCVSGGGGGAAARRGWGVERVSELVHQEAECVMGELLFR